MQLKELFTTTAHSAGYSLNRLSRAAGHGDNYISAMLSRGSSPQLNTVVNLLNVCGYVLCAVPRDSVPSNALVIDSDNTSSK